MAISSGNSSTKGAKGAAFAPSRGEKDIDEETFQKQPMPGAPPSLEEEEEDGRRGGAANGMMGVGGEEEEGAHKSVGGSSGLGESLELSAPISMPEDLVEGRRSRTPYRRSVSEVSRSISPSHPLPPSRSISSPEEKHRPFAVVKRKYSVLYITRSFVSGRIKECTSKQDPL
jgi:hypothetical protein